MPQLIKMWEFGPVITKLLKEKTAGFVEEAWKEVVRDTPVRTGYARANWFVSPKVPKEKPVPAKKNYKGTYPYPIAQTNVNMGKRDYATYYLSNPTEYIGKLNTGTSKQAPPLFIQKAILRTVLAFNNKKS